MKFLTISIYFLFFLFQEIKGLIHFVKNFFLYKFTPVKGKSFKTFLEKNITILKLSEKKQSKKKILITDFVSVPGYTSLTGLIGRYISIVREQEPIVLLRKGDYTGLKIFKSFGVKKIIFIDLGLPFNFNKIKFFLKSLQILNNFKNVDEFLKYKKGQIDIGIIVYDHILRHTGIGTTNKLNFKFYYFLYLALTLDNFCKKFFFKNEIDVVVQSEHQFLPSSIIFQNALINNCKVYAHEGVSKKLCVRVFKDFSERFTNRSLFSKELFDFVYRHHRDVAIKNGLKILNDRFSGAVLSQVRGSKNAFEPRINFTKKELCISKGWDLNKPIIGIFSSDFSDGNFVNGWTTFKDNFTWFRKTLETIRNIKSVNWLIKEKIVDDKTKAKIKVSDEVEKILRNKKHVAMFENKYSAACLKDCLSLVITSTGSVGFEYPCYGIPSIICGQSYYGGFGFTHEAKTEKEYLSYLNNIDDLEKFKLTTDQIRMALVYFNICFDLTKIELPLINNFYLSRHIGKEKFWGEMTGFIKDYDKKNDYFLQMLKIQIKNNYKHTIDLNKLPNFQINNNLSMA